MNFMRNALVCFSALCVFAAAADPAKTTPKSSPAPGELIIKDVQVSFEEVDESPSPTPKPSPKPEAKKKPVKKKKSKTAP